MKKKIKLRDMTEEQFVSWCKDNCPNSKNLNTRIDCNSVKCPFAHVLCNERDSANCWLYNKEDFSDKFLDQEVEIEVPDILTPEEKEYLEAVIKPFRSWVKSIGKIHCELDDERLVIAINHCPAITIPTTNCLRFEGITQDDSFTLEELGL
jgi:hypothetical protein